MNAREDNDAPIEGAEEPINYRGGDLVGITQHLQAGGFDDLNTKALWLTWPMRGPERAMPGDRLDLDPRPRGCRLNPYDEALPR